FAADARLNDGGDVGDVDSEARRGFAIDLHLDLRERRFLVDGDIRRTGNELQDIDELGSDPPCLLEFMAEDFDDEVTVRSGDLVVDAVDHWLGKADDGTGDLGVTLAEAPDQVILVAMIRPRVVGLEADEALDVGRSPRIGAVVVASELADNGGDLR